MKEKEKNKYGRKKDDRIDIITLDLEPGKKQNKTVVNQQKRQSEDGPKKRKVSNKELARVTYLFVGIFLFMMGYMVYFNVFQSKEIINSPYNVRLDSMAERVVRGKILDKNGEVLAETKINEDGTETRIYPYGDVFAHVVGYDSHGKSGLESAENFHLLTSNAFFAEKLFKEFREEKNIGDNIVTTLDADLQQTAHQALGEYKGAVVVMEVSTGKILAMVSKPGFDPNMIVKDWNKLAASGDGVLLNRATQGMYAPGSVFKLVTTLAYMRQEADYENYAYLCEGQFEHEGTIIHCAKNRAHHQEDLKMSFANSCNASYSNIGLQLQFSNYRKTAQDLLFDAKLPCAFPYAKSKFRLTEDAGSAEVMMTAIGQGKTQVSPYHMVLISAAIANGGILMEPYFVDQIVNYTGTTVEKYMPKKYTELMNSKEASALKEYMTAVVDAGTASALKGEDYTVAGKTGTAEYSSDKEKSHSWFAGFTNIDNPELAISVIVESADNSGMSAVAVAKKVLNAYYY